MAGWGGHRKGAGRKLNPLKSAKIAADLIERGKRILGDGNAPTPLDFLLQQLWDPQNSFDVRMDAAKAALPYCHPRLQSVDITSEEDRTVRIEFVEFTREAVLQAPSAFSAAVSNQPAIPALAVRQAPSVAPDPILIAVNAVLTDEEHTENE
jgi:hypothetical protein